MMRNWDELAKNVSSLSVKPCLWTMNFPESVRNAWTAHNLVEFGYLLNIIKLSHITDEAKENRIRSFFHLRALFIQKSSASFGLNPVFPINQACFFVAKTIAKPGESVFNILMPSVETIVGIVPMGMDRSLASYVDNDDIELNEFLISSTGKTLLYIPGLFEYAKDDTARLFSENALFDFTADDLNNLRCVVGSASANYFDALEKIDRICHQKKPSLGYELEKLCAALLRGSKLKSGTETESNIHESESAVVHFYTIWRNKVTPETIEKIRHYTSTHGSIFLESYILTLFSHTMHTTLPLTDAEHAHLKDLARRNRSIFPCAQQIGEQLQLFVAHHPNLRLIPLLGEEAAFLGDELMPDADVLKKLAENLVESMPRRLPLLGIDDEAFLKQPFFDLMACHLLHYDISEGVLPCFAGKIKDLQDALSIFLLLPVTLWTQFVKAHQNMLCALLVENDVAPAMTLFLNRMPMVDWKPFISAFFSQPILRVLFDGYVLAQLLHEFPRSQWENLRDAMSGGDKIFVQPCDFIDFLHALPVDDWKNAIQVFEVAIKKLYRSPEALALLFQVVPDDERWSEENIRVLCKALKPILDSALKNPQVLSHIIRSLQFNRKTITLKILLTEFAEQIVTDKEQFFNIIKTLPSRERQLVTPLFGPRLMAMVFDCDRDVAHFLTRFSTDIDRISFLRAMRDCFPDTIKISPKSLYDVLGQYPACQSEIIVALRKKIPLVFAELLTIFRNEEAVGDLPSLKLQMLFLSLFERASFILRENSLIPVELLQRLERYQKICQRNVAGKGTCEVSVQTRPVVEPLDPVQLCQPSDGRTHAVSHRGRSVIMQNALQEPTVGVRPTNAQQRYTGNTQAFFHTSQRRAEFYVRPGNSQSSQGSRFPLTGRVAELRYGHTWY